MGHLKNNNEYMYNYIHERVTLQVLSEDLILKGILSQRLVTVLDSIITLSSIYSNLGSSTILKGNVPGPSELS